MCTEMLVQCVSFFFLSHKEKDNEVMYCLLEKFYLLTDHSHKVIVKVEEKRKIDLNSPYYLFQRDIRSLMIEPDVRNN